MSNKKLNEEASAKKIDKIKKQQEKTKKAEELKKLRAKIKREVDYTMDGSVKQLFLNLTKMQIPFDYEYTLEEYFPDEMKKDEHGNYYLKIGDPKTMFCAHLDTYCYEYKKVWHVIEDNIIKTDGTTTLGGDDKAGVVIILKMIEAGIPGLYYFFRGEEGVTSPTGTWGSKQALKSYRENFKKYEKCIAFDRKGYDSIISQQMYSDCCSDEFVDELKSKFNSNGLKYVDDPTGMWCDSGVFMEIIPECTNISVGYVNEHTFSEQQDIEHLEKLVKACVNIDWESLPVKRDPSKASYGVGRYHYDWDYEWDYHYSNNIKKSKKKSGSGVRDFVKMDEMFWHVVDILDDAGYSPLNEDYFEEGEEMYFQNHKTGDFFGLRIIDFEIFISEDETLKSYEHVGDLNTFEKYVSIGAGGDNLDDEARRHLDSISREIRSDDDIELTYSGGEEEFTHNQELAFTRLIKERPKTVQLVFDDIQDKNKLEVRPDTWLKLEKEMYNINLIVDYGDYGINPDDFIDWLSYNWDKASKLLSSVENTNVDKDNTNSYVDKIYYDIALNQAPRQIEQFIKQVIDKDHVMDKKDYDKYQKDIDRWIKDKYNKELNNYNELINHRTFIDWLKNHRRDLLEYYRK